MSRRTRILIVDDDKLFRRKLKYDLEKERFQCETTSSYDSAATLIEGGQPPDVYILDYELGQNGSGLDLCRKIKTSTHAPVIMISGYDDEELVVNCLQAGADQHITKPYRSRELAARIHALLRLTGRADPGRGDAGSAGLRVQLKGKTLTHQERTVAVSELEASILATLLANFEHPVSRESLYRSVYGTEPVAFTRTLDALVTRARKKLAMVSSRHRIQTIRGFGFILNWTGNGRN